MGNVPEFVCADRERAEYLADFFGGLPKVSEYVICFVPPRKNPLPEQIAGEYASKGLYYFDADDCSKSAENFSVLREYYTKKSYPLSPLKIDDLPENIRALLNNNRIEVADFSAPARVYI